MKFRLITGAVLTLFPAFLFGQLNTLSDADRKKAEKALSEAGSALQEMYCQQNAADPKCKEFNKVDLTKALAIGEVYKFKGVYPTTMGADPAKKQKLQDATVVITGTKVGGKPGAKVDLETGGKSVTLQAEHAGRGVINTAGLMKGLEAQLGKNPKEKAKELMPALALFSAAAGGSDMFYTQVTMAEIASRKQKTNDKETGSFAKEKLGGVPVLAYQTTSKSGDKIDIAVNGDLKFRVQRQYTTHHKTGQKIGFELISYKK